MHTLGWFRYRPLHPSLTPVPPTLYSPHHDSNGEIHEPQRDSDSCTYANARHDTLSIFPGLRLFCNVCWGKT